MTTVFIGGSRRVARLPEEALRRLDAIIGQGFTVIVGDANGVDKAVQRYMAARHYEKVTVFCSGDACRNNLGSWPVRHVHSSRQAPGYQFYAAKDREMAQVADYGLMVWDGKSAGTPLNVLRLVRAGKKAVLVDVPLKTTTTFKQPQDWDHFVAGCTPALRHDLQSRADPEEWSPTPRASPLFDPVLAGTIRT